MSVIFEYYADLKAMKYADLTAAMPLVLLYTPTLTHTHTGTLFFWFPVPHKIDTGNLCLLYFHIAISFKICTLTTSAGTTTTTTLLWMLDQIIMKLQSVEIKSCLLASRVVDSLHPNHL
jgi:hypothetical protein